jgi:hypothetical protein
MASGSSSPPCAPHRLVKTWNALGERPNRPSPFKGMSPARKRPEKAKPTPPKPDVVEQQDPGHTVSAFLNDLKKATSDKARKKLGLPSGRD